jgi:hypothetical protein
LGHRANYVLIEDGQPSISFSRWGALSIPAVVLSGPEATLAYVRQLTPDDSLLEDTWAEGGMLLDLDAHRLLFWGGEMILWRPYLRRPLLKALPTLWPGWTVAWALFEMADLARSLGWEVARVLDHTPDDLRLLLEGEPGISEDRLLEAIAPEGTGTALPNPRTRSELEERLQGTSTLGGAGTALTIRWITGEIGDYLFSERWMTDETGRHFFAAAPYQILSLGPPLVPLMHSRPTAVLPKEGHEREPAGAYVDEGARAIWLGVSEALDPRELEAVARRWPGWQVQGHAEGLVGQVRLSGRDPSVLMVPEQQALEELIAELTREQEIDPGALFQALSQGGKPVTVGKGFFSQDVPPLSPEERRERLKDLFQLGRESDRTPH